MINSIIEGYAKFTKPNKNYIESFVVSNMQLLNINFEIPPSCHLLCDANDNIITLDFVEFENGQEKYKGQVFIIYYKEKSNYQFKILETNEIKNGTFIIIEGKYYVFQRKIMSNYYSKIYYENRQIKFLNSKKNSLLHCHDNIEYMINEKHSLSDEVIDILLTIINSNGNSQNKKYDKLIFSVDEDKMFVYCIYKTDEKNNYCHVFCSKIYNTKFFYLFKEMLMRNDFIDILYGIKNVPFIESDKYNIICYPNIGSTKETNLHIEINKFKKNEKKHNECKKNKCDCKIKNVNTNKSELNKNQNFVYNFSKNNYIINIVEDTKMINSEHVIFLLRAILLENKVIFISKDTYKLFLAIHFFLKIIEPFNWSNMIFSLLPEKFFDLLDSPFPYIIGLNGEYKYLKSLVKKQKAVIFDLNKMKIKNIPKTELIFEKELLAKMEIDGWIYSLGLYTNVIKNNIDIAREKLISKNINDIDYLEKIISNPNKIIDEIKLEHVGFFDDFFATKMFMKYIITKDDNACCVNIDIHQDKIKYMCSSFKQIDLNKIYELWQRLMICPKKNSDEMVTNLYDVKLLPVEQICFLSPYIFEYYSKIKNYIKISELYNYLNDNNIIFSPSMFKNINLFDYDYDLSFFRFYDLSGYKIEALNENLEDIKAINIYKDNLLHNQITLIDVNDIINIIKLERKSYDKEEMLKEKNQLFWNICFYFKIVNLPITLENQHNTIVSSIHDNIQINGQFEPKLIFIKKQ